MLAVCHLHAGVGQVLPELLFDQLEDNSLEKENGKTSHELITAHSLIDNSRSMLCCFNKKLKSALDKEDHSNNT